MLIFAYLTLALFCIKELICRTFSMDVEGPLADHRQQTQDSRQKITDCRQQTKDTRPKTMDDE